jgi:M61 glycyl aminopeptidase
MQRKRYALTMCESPPENFPFKNTLALGAVFICLLASLPAYSQNENLRFHWEDSFSATEQQRLQHWIIRTDEALTELVGELPFTRHIFFHRRDGSREPVPWAHTQRSPTQGVHFYVDMSYPQRDFDEDWTAPHELSHLVIPYLGRKNAWFAEGFASYMQYQVMMQMGVLTSTDAKQRYTKRIERAEKKFALDDLPFAEAAPKLRAMGQYPTMYWGGAVYFKQVAQQLETQGSISLLATLVSYVSCCRNEDASLQSLIERLDQLASGVVFRHCMDEFERQPGFPEIP